MDASSTEARARVILLGLGFTAPQLDEKLSTLSGGWRSRCALASALLQKPDLVRVECHDFIVACDILRHFSSFSMSLPTISVRSVTGASLVMPM